MKNEQTIFILNSLIEINNDRIEGYENASSETDEFDLKELFSRVSYTSEKCIEELQLEVLRLGGKPTDQTRTAGKIFRIWMDFKASITGLNRSAILSSCEQGEDVAVSVYERILKEKSPENLSAEQIRMIYAQYQSIKSDHDKVRLLRDELVESH